MLRSAAQVRRLTNPPGRAGPPEDPLRTGCAESHAGHHPLPRRRRWSLRPAPAEVAKGPVLVGRMVLYYWPGHGWVRGTVARRSRTHGFSHVVRYSPRSALRWSTRCSMPPRTGRRAAGSCCARRPSLPVTLAGRPQWALRPARPDCRDT